MRTQQKRLLGMILIFTSIAATAGCDNEVRRSLSNMIDDQEQTAEVLSENIQEYIGEFEHELREHTELMTTQWDASDWEIPVNGPDAQFNGDVDHDYELVLTSGCPMIDFRREGDLSSEERSRQMGETIRCRCLRNIGNQYRRELNALRPEVFGEMRENLAMVTDEELEFTAPLIREQNPGYTLEQAEAAINRRREALLQDPTTTPTREYCRY